ncbi:NAD(P)H-dependent oxidoreductase [Gangjinia marincola]|uniref:NAD(P)H-dependent oxidoreductase n=1 Tax=Gangjinia marincola TaxID=578463 RepID=A0ABP3XR47_9FLAO
MDSISALSWRYATKKFDASKQLPEDKLTTLKKAFNLTATSYGLQPLQLVVIKDKNLQQELVEHSMGQQQVAQASHVLVFCIEKEINENYIKEYFKRVQRIRNTPDTILDPFKNFLIDDFKAKEREQIKQWSINQAYLAMGNLLTVCALEHIDACPMEGFSPVAYDQALALKSKNLQSVLVMPIGYRAKDDIFAEMEKVRRPLSETITEL